jgi:hypothetical protein
MHGRYMTVVPADGHAGPARFSDDTTVSRISSPANAGALLELLGFSGGQAARPIDLRQ